MFNIINQLTLIKGTIAQIGSSLFSNDTNETSNSTAAQPLAQQQQPEHQQFQRQKRYKSNKAIMSFEYISILPTEIRNGDRIIIRGTTRENAEQFTIDFANGTCPNPPNISLSLQIVPQQTSLILTYKRDNDWNLYKESSTFSLDGNNFDMMFGFANDTITIYSGGNNYIDAISPENGLSDIKSLQVGGDVEKIRELTFLYDVTL